MLLWGLPAACYSFRFYFLETGFFSTYPSPNTHPKHVCTGTFALVPYYDESTRAFASLRGRLRVALEDARFVEFAEQHFPGINVTRDLAFTDSTPVYFLRKSI